MRNYLFAFILLSPLVLLSQNDVTLFTSLSGCGGYGALVDRTTNIELNDYQGQPLGVFNTTFIDHGANVGGTARLGVKWRNLMGGFQFSYDRFFFRKRWINTKPQMFTKNNFTENTKLEYHVLSYSAFVGYSFSVCKHLNVVPMLSLGSFTGFLNDHHTSLNKPDPESRWGFYHFMQHKFLMNVSCLFEVPFNRFSFFVAPRYGFIFWDNKVMSFPNTVKHTEHISVGSVETGLLVNLYTFKGKQSKP